VKFETFLGEFFGQKTQVFFFHPNLPTFDSMASHHRVISFLHHNFTTIDRWEGVPAIDLALPPTPTSVS
jgi:hypothetical protein